MKTIKKQRGFFAVLAVTLLVTAVLITNCMDPISGAVVNNGNGNGGDIDNYRAPAGMGYIRLGLESTARSTIKPISFTATQVQGMYFKVEIVEVDGDTSHDKTIPATFADAPVSYTTLTANATPLDGGTTQDPIQYTVTVYAFLDNLGAQPVGSGHGSVNIVTSVGSNVTINLEGDSGVGNGSFTYNVTTPTTPATLSTSTMDVFDYPYVSATSVSVLPGNTAITLAPNATNSTANVALPSGFYEVIFTFEQTNYQKIVVRRMLHVFQNMTSIMTPWIVPNLGSTQYAVNYNLMNTGDPATSTVVPHSLNPISHGTAIADDYAGAPPTNGTDSFLGFFRTLELTDITPFSFATRIISALTLYAKWEAAPSDGLTFILTFNIANADPVPVGSGTLSQNAYYSGGLVTPVSLSLSNASDFVVGSIKWYFADDEFNVDTLTLSASGIGAGPNISYLTAMTHTFTVYAIPLGETIPVSNTFTLEITAYNYAP
ncbi:MAG: hypothetical protein LBI09_01685 [Nitrososphaerota archaeon]|jgi:hypothetical protein|nr:hypothetical protein [Nitrososphaerota archaeon]